MYCIIHTVSTEVKKSPKLIFVLVLPLTEEKNPLYIVKIKCNL